MGRRSISLVLRESLRAEPGHVTYFYFYPMVPEPHGLTELLGRLENGVFGWAGSWPSKTLFLWKNRKMVIMEQLVA